MPESTVPVIGGGAASNLTLSFKLEELDALIKEVRQLREENLKIFQDIALYHKAIFNLICAVHNNVIGADIINCIRFSSRLNSADFMAKNLIPTAKTFPNRIDHLKHAIAQTEIDGLYMEFGVFKGDSINEIALAKPDKIVYGFDSFEGLPEDWTNSMSHGTFDLQGVLPQVKENVRLIKGWFDKTLPDFLKEHTENCAFIHIDCDLYSSTKTVFDALKERIVSGTVIVFDEYINYLGWEQGEHKAFVELMQEKNLTCDYISCCTMQVAVKIK